LYEAELEKNKKKVRTISPFDDEEAEEEEEMVGPTRRLARTRVISSSDR
jgi:hypothetical protein